MFYQQILSFEELMTELNKPVEEVDLFNELSSLKKENDKLKATDILNNIKLNEKSKL